ncbi:MAG TPA: hypothetical protein VGN49_07970 [Micrococcaceae bacterium]|jgi:hypothetical protein|nr:hypothetical protein [Micrococcaceae bacterium]
MTGLARLGLRVYPPSFRARYGAELSALVEELPSSGRTTADLWLGAVRAWVRPVFGGAEGRRRRLQASVTTTWVAWCAGFMIVPAMAKTLLDQPSVGPTTPVRVLVYAGEMLLLAGWVVALFGVLLMIPRVLGPALRVRPWAVLGPLLPALVLGLGVLLVLIVFVLAHASGGPGMQVLFYLWLAAVAGLLCCLGIGPAVSLGRLAPGMAVLRVPAWLAAALSWTLVLMTCCCIAAVLLAGRATLLNSPAPVIAVLAIGSLASVVAVTSSSRGIGAAVRP